MITEILYVDPVVRSDMVVSHSVQESRLRVLVEPGVSYTTVKPAAVGVGDEGKPQVITMLVALMSCCTAVRSIASVPTA